MSAEPERPRILVVEDNPSMLGAMCDVLDSLGYDAHGVELPSQALAVIRRWTFQAVVVDQGLAEMTGILLAEQLRGVQCDVGTVVVSGYPRETLQTDYTVLEKPFSTRQLTDAIEHVVAR